MRLDNAFRGVSSRDAAVKPTGKYLSRPLKALSSLMLRSWEGYSSVNILATVDVKIEVLILDFFVFAVFPDSIDCIV